MCTPSALCPLASHGFVSPTSRQQSSLCSWCMTGYHTHILTGADCAWDLFNPSLLGCTSMCCVATCAGVGKRGQRAHFHAQERRLLLEGAAQLMFPLCLGWLAWKARGKDVIWKGCKMSVTPGASISSNMAVLGFTQGTSCLGCRFDVRSMGKNIRSFWKIKGDLISCSHQGAGFTNMSILC